MNLLDVLSHEADMGLLRRIALVLELVDRKTIVRLANLFDVVLEATVGEERRGLCLRSGRTGQSARPLGNVGEELGRLEGIGLLLQELIVEGGKARLLRLLRHSACGQRVLTALLGSGLGGSPNTRKLASSSSKSGEIGLLSGELRALLLCGDILCVLIAGVQKVRVGLVVGEVLLVGKICLSRIRAVSAKGTGGDGLPGQVRLLLLVLELLSRERLPIHVPHKGRHVLVGVEATKIGRASTGGSQASGGTKKRLRRIRASGNLIDTLLLRRIDGGNKVAWV